MGRTFWLHRGKHTADGPMGWPFVRASLAPRPEWFSSTDSTAPPKAAASVSLIMPGMLVLRAMFSVAMNAPPRSSSTWVSPMVT